MYNYFKFYKYLFRYRYYLIVFFLFWFSINTGSKYITNEFIKNEFFENKFNFLRAILPYLILFKFILYDFFYNKKKLLNFDSFSTLFFLYSFVQLTGLLYYKQNLYEHYWLICIFALMLFYNLVNYENNIVLLKLIKLMSISLLLILFFIFLFLVLKENILSINLLYHSNAFNLLFQNEQIPRSSGLSRMALVLFIFFNCLYLTDKNFSYFKNFVLIINIIFVTTIFTLQSRGTIISFLIIVTLNIYLYENINFYNKLKYLILILLLPALFFISYPYLKVFLIKNIEINNVHEKNLNHEINVNDFKFHLRQDFFIIEEKSEEDLKNKIISFSNNRLDAWNYLLQIFFNNKINQNMKKKLISFDLEKFLIKNKKNLITGHGPQADRHFLHNKLNNMADSIKGPFGAHASNGYIYSLICSGILGFFIFVAINILVFFKYTKLIINKKKIGLISDPFLIASILSIIFLQFRILFENSYSVFGVDLLIFCSSYLIINNKYKEIKN